MNKRLGLALAAFVVWAAITVVGGNISSGGEGSLLDGVTAGIGWTWVAAAGFILAIVLWQRWSDVALNRAATARGWMMAWVPMLFIVIALEFAVALGLPPAGVLAFILINTLLVGFSEELMFRGVLLQAFRHTTTIWPAVLLTSVVFGVVHSLNVFVTGDLTAALLQSSAAFLSGLVFIALRLRTGSLWPPIVVHALWDFATFTIGAAGKGAAAGAATTAAAAAPDGSSMKVLLPILLVLPNAIYGLWLMRNISATHSDPNT